MKNGHWIALLGTALIFQAHAQQPTTKNTAENAFSSLSLTITQSVISQVPGPDVGRVRCDGNGNVYLRPYSADRAAAGTLYQTPIQEIKADGALGETFRSSDFGPGFWARDFFPTEDGGLYQVAYNSKLEFFLLAFSSDGSFKKSTRIETDFVSPYQLAVFKSGEFLISGTVGKNGHQLFTAVFSPAGKLIKKISTPEDNDLQAAAEQGDSSLVPENGFGNRATHFGDVVAGSDGNLYLMRSGPRAWVYGISPTGEVVKKFFVDGGNTKLRALNIKSAPARLVVAFAGPSGAGDLLKVVDLDGNSVVDYAYNDSRLPATFLACYLPPAFIFTQADGMGPISLFRAEPR